MLSSYCTCLSSVLGETCVRHHQRNLIQLIAATLVRISRPGKHFLIETEDEDTESSNPLDGNKDASRDAFKEHRDSPAPIKNTPIANKIIYKLFCFEGANEHPIQGASPHQGQKYSSKPK